MELKYRRPWVQSSVREKRHTTSYFMTVSEEGNPHSRGPRRRGMVSITTNRKDTVPFLVVWGAKTGAKNHFVDDPEE